MGFYFKAGYALLPTRGLRTELLHSLDDEDLSWLPMGETEMTWFCKQPPIAYCQECGLAYKKWDYGDFREYCSVHRAPRVDKQRRIDEVVYWATANWERLEKQILEEELKNRNAYDEQMAAYHNAYFKRP